MPRTLLAALVAAILASGCATLAPDYQTPAAPVPAEWPAGSATPVAALPVDIAWEQYFTDPRLRQLIALTLRNNRDLRVAGLNIEKARAQYQIQRADLFPTVGYGRTAGVHRYRTDCHPIRSDSN